MQSDNLPGRGDRISDLQNGLNAEAAPVLLSDPFLQQPTEDTVQVVWFTEFEGTAHRVEYGENLTADAETTLLSRTREDSDSRVQGRAFPGLTRREIWRHAATVTGLTSGGDRLPYRVLSRHDNGKVVLSDTFTLAAAPPKGKPLKILLTSDHQLKPMTPANLQKVVETAGQVDAVFFAGDLVNVSDRASEWFDDARGLSFFPALQGRTQSVLEKDGVSTTYTGGAIIQHAPLFPIIGNHEVMGRHSTAGKLKDELANTLPRKLVSRFYPLPERANTDSDHRRDPKIMAWIKKHSFNTDTYEEIFSLPTTPLPDGHKTEQYYALSFGDVRLVSLYVTQIWRSPSLSPETKGRYRESADTLNNPEVWGYGQHIFEEIRKGSTQYNWLQQELASDAFKRAKYTVVMLHHPPHTLGGNVVPAFTDPVAVENRSEDGALQSVQYEYPKDADYIVRDLVPLLESSGVDLVFYGHSHLWNRFVSEAGTHFLETSNVGNSYGAHLAGNPRNVPTTEQVSEAGDLSAFGKGYVTLGDPNGLTPVVPTVAPLTDDNGQPLPYLASNDITSFTIFNTGSATLTSYYFDTREPDSAVVKFDEFKLGQP
ncbi:MAG: metallophosphoesterase [Cyanobacteria bacterium J06649_5]